MNIKSFQSSNNFKIAGVTLSGGRYSDFHFCLMEYFPDSKRWVLSKLYSEKEAKVSGEEDRQLNDLIIEHNLKEIVTDIPLTMPACYDCKLKCPGEIVCIDPTVTFVRSEMNKFIEEDSKLIYIAPKKYEQARLNSLEIDYVRNIFSKKTKEHILSKSFKRRLKKGFLPYWNRSIDFWIWANYYDQLLSIFNYSYDSFGLTPHIQVMRINYFRKYLNNRVKFFESDIFLVLLELHRNNIITKKQLIDLKDLEYGAQSRLNVIKRIEEKINIFIYEHDLNVLINDPRAFAAFILSLSGITAIIGKCIELPIWCTKDQTNFLVPDFSFAN